MLSSAVASTDSASQGTGTGPRPSNPKWTDFFPISFYLITSRDATYAQGIRPSNVHYQSPYPIPSRYRVGEELPLPSPNGLTVLVTLQATCTALRKPQSVNKRSTCFKIGAETWPWWERAPVSARCVAVRTHKTTLLESAPTRTCWNAGPSMCSS